jgi:hypothetical protein
MPGILQRLDKILQLRLERPIVMKGISMCRVCSDALKGTALVGGDMIGLVAFDFVLWIILRGVMRIALVVKISGVNGDDGP